MVEPRQTRKAAAESAPPTPPQQKKTRTTEPEALVRRGAPLSQVQPLTTRAMQNLRDTDLDTLSQRACALSLGKVLKFCFLTTCTVAWLCSIARRGRHWPTCFDQTCGCPSEGPLTTLDSPEAPEPSLTPTQEFRTCCMVRRKKKGSKWKNQVCKACESSLTPKKNGCTCTKCHTWARSAECERAVVSMQCCRLTGVVSLESSQSFYSEGPGGSSSSGLPCVSTSRLPRSETRDRHRASEWPSWLHCSQRRLTWQRRVKARQRCRGTRRLRTPQRWATGLRSGGCAVRSAAPGRTRGRPGCTPGVAYRPFRHGSCAHGRDSRCRSIWPHRVRARRSRRAVRKRRTLGEAAGAGDVPAGDANQQAPAAGLEAEDVRYTQEATAASHELSPPTGQEA